MSASSPARHNRLLIVRAPWGLTFSVGTDVFRGRLFTGAGFSQACEVVGNGRRETLFNSAMEKLLFESAPRGRTVHNLLTQHPVDWLSFRSLILTRGRVG